MEVADSTVSRRHHHYGISNLKAVACDLLIYLGIASVFAILTVTLWFLCLLTG